jgi:hypothetical protein
MYLYAPDQIFFEKSLPLTAKQMYFMSFSGPILSNATPAIYIGSLYRMIIGSND